MRWTRYLVEDFSFSTRPSFGIVIDVGCGGGKVLDRLQDGGHLALGIDIDEESLRLSRKRGLWVVKASAERLPVRTASLDGAVCKVAIPYTDERKAIAEIARALKPGAVGRLCYHGAGYYLRTLLAGPEWSARAYGLRSLINTWIYAVAGRRLPGWLGDTTYQSTRRLRKYYRHSELRLESSVEGRAFLGLPVFVYHVVAKR